MFNRASIRFAYRPLSREVLLSKKRTWFADAEATTDTTATDTTTAGDDKGKGASAADAKFTQADLDKVAGNRAKEATAAARKALLKELGIDPDDPKAVDLVKGKLTAAQQAEDAKKSAEEKALEKIAQLEKERDEAKALADTEKQNRRAAIIDTRLETLAAKVGAQFPSDVIDYARRNYADKVTALMDDSGKVDETKVAALIEEIKKQRPNFFDTRKGAGTGSHGGGRTEHPDSDGDKAAKARLRAQVRNNF